MSDRVPNRFDIKLSRASTNRVKEASERIEAVKRASRDLKELGEDTEDIDAQIADAERVAKILLERFSK